MKRGFFVGLGLSVWRVLRCNPFCMGGYDPVPEKKIPKYTREKEKELVKDQLDGLDVYAAGNSDLNFVFDRYISTKTDLKKLF